VSTYPGWRPQYFNFFRLCDAGFGLLFIGVAGCIADRITSAPNEPEQVDVQLSGSSVPSCSITLGAVRPVTARRMFRWRRLLCRGPVFAIAPTTCDFRADDARRGFFEREGMQAFCPKGRAPSR